MPRLVRVRGSSTVNVDPVAGRALDRDRAAERVDDLLDDPETETDAAVVAAGRGPLEAAEDALVIVGRDAEAPIADRDDARVVAAASSADVDRLAVAVLDGVRDQVGDHLVEAALVPAADDRRVGAWTFSVEPTRAASSLKRGADLVDDLREVDRLDVQLEAPGGDARDVEQLVDQAVQPRRLRVDLLDLGDQARAAVAAPSRCAIRDRFATSSFSDVSGVRSSCDATDRKSSRRTIALRRASSARF